MNGFLSVGFINIRSYFQPKIYSAEIPAEAVRPVSSKIFCRISLSYIVGRFYVFLVFGNVSDKLRLEKVVLPNRCIDEKFL